MTEEPGNKYGSFYGQPTPGLPFGQPAAPAGPAQHPCASLFATRDDAEDGGGGVGKAVVVVVLILLVIGAGAGVVMLGGPSALMPKRSQAAAMANNPQSV